MSHRSGHSDDRRRRVLTEEVVNGTEGRLAAAARCVRSVDGAVNGYAEAARPEHQPRVTDLVPRRPLAYALLVGCGGAVIGGLVALYSAAAGTAIAGPVSELVDLGSSGSLAAWFSSLILLLVASTALLLYSLRRHKQSDYHGRYRVWLWTALVAFGMSLCTTSPIHQHVAAWLAGRTGWQLPGGTPLFWLVPAAALLGILGLRLVLEVRGSRLALTALNLSVVAHIAAVATPHIGRLAATPAHAVMIGVGSQMAGHLLLLLGVALFARHVLLDIEGLVPARAKKPNAANVSETSSSAAAAERLGVKRDPPHATPAAPAGRTDLEPDNVAARRRREESELEQEWYESRDGDNRRRNQSRPDDEAQEDDDEDSQPQGRKLSKADRKRLRRLKSQQRETGFN